MTLGDAAGGPPLKKRSIAAARASVAAASAEAPRPASRTSAGAKRSRGEERGSTAEAEEQRESVRRRTESAEDEDLELGSSSSSTATPATPASPLSGAPTGTNRTLVYDVESPTPARRGRVLLTSTPRFIREAREDAARDAAPQSTATAVLSTPLRLLRAAQELWAPAGRSLQRRHAQAHDSGPPARAAHDDTTQQLSRRATHSPPLVSPWGRLSSILPATESLPSCLERSDVERLARLPTPSAAAEGSAAATSVAASRRSSLSTTTAGRPHGFHGAAPVGSLVLDADTDDDATVSLSRLSSPVAAAADEERPSLRPHELRRGDASAALTGACDVRFARVSSLSESLADVVSSSRSTARSSLTSAGVADGHSRRSSGARAVGASESSLAGDRGAAASAVDVAVPRRSGTAMEPPNVSSILPDAEERAHRRRLQRHGHADGPPREAAHEPQGRCRDGRDNVVLLNVTRAPPPAATPHAGGGAAGRLSQRQASDIHATASAQPPAPRPFASTTNPSQVRRRVARASRLAVVLLTALLSAWAVAATAMPLLSLTSYRAAAEARFVHTHVNPVSDLQALYRVAPSSLDAAGVVRLYHRSLSEGVERLERATQHLVPDDDTPPSQRLFYYRAMLRAYLALSRTCELYARSRDASPWRRHIAYPVADVWRYGVRGLWRNAMAARRSAAASAAWRDGLGSVVACAAQSELLPCPSLLYVEEAMARDAAQFVYTDVNAVHESPQRRRRLQDWRARLHRDWGSEVYLETLLSYVRSGVRELTRDYNR